MGFTPPTWVPELPRIPDNISVEQFVFEEEHGRLPLRDSRPPFQCGLSGKSYSFLETRERVDFLARSIGKELGFKPIAGSEWNKVVAVFSVNTIDYMTACWAVHKLGGVLTAANAAYNAAELEFQLRHSGAKAVFTCLPLLKTAKEACAKFGIPDERIYILPLPASATPGLSAPGLKTADDLIAAGRKLPALETLKWQAGEGSRRTAFLCYSSGTSGLPKGVMISHVNVIANTMQIRTFEQPGRERLRKARGVEVYTENCLGLLPMSHIYGLIVISHVGPYRGDGVVVLPRYDFKQLLQGVQDFKISMLYVVPPMIIHITKAPDVCKQYDLSSVLGLFTGAAPLGKETADELSKHYPSWAIRQGYGLTETSTVVCSTPENDIFLGSSGSLLPGVKVRIVTPEGEEVTEYDRPGELWVQSPSVTLGYLKNESATNETFTNEKDGRYMRTGDEAVIRKSPQGNEHIFITDRIKE